MGFGMGFGRTGDIAPWFAMNLRAPLFVSHITNH